MQWLILANQLSFFNKKIIWITKTFIAFKINYCCELCSLKFHNFLTFLSRIGFCCCCANHKNRIEPFPRTGPRIQRHPIHRECVKFSSIVARNMTDCANNNLPPKRDVWRAEPANQFEQPSSLSWAIVGHHYSFGCSDCRPFSPIISNIYGLTIIELVCLLSRVNTLDHTK